MLDSTVLTIGTALRRAQDASLPVEVLVHGEWIGGSVLGLDGHGALLDGDHGESAVIRLEDVCAVRVHPPDVPEGRVYAEQPAAWQHRFRSPATQAEVAALG